MVQQREILGIIFLLPLFASLTGKTHFGAFDVPGAVGTDHAKFFEREATFQLIARMTGVYDVLARRRTAVARLGLDMIFGLGFA